MKLLSLLSLIPVLIICILLATFQPSALALDNCITPAQAKKVCKDFIGPFKPGLNACYYGGHYIVNGFIMDPYFMSPYFKVPLKAPEPMVYPPEPKVAVEPEPKPEPKSKPTSIFDIFDIFRIIK